MPLEIQVKFIQRGVFFAGEKLSATLTFVNKSPDDVRSINANTLHKSTSPIPSLKSKHSYTSLTSTSAIDLFRPLLSPLPTEDTALKYRSLSESFPTLSPNSPNLGKSHSQHSLPVPLAPSTFLRLLFGTVHVIGTFRLDPNAVRTDYFDSLRKISGCVPPLDANEYPVLITQPSILFVDLSLPLNEPKTYNFHMLLPMALPPSFRGKYVKFGYKLVVQVQFLDTAKPVLRQLPIRLFSVIEDDGNTPRFDVLHPTMLKEQGHVVDPDVPKPQRPHKTHEEMVTLLKQLDEAVGEEQALVEQFQNGHWMRKIQVFLQHAATPVFEITQGGQRVARVQLPRAVLRLGELLQGVVDFRDAAVKAVHVSVTLEARETVVESVAKRAARCTAHAHMHSNVQNTLLCPFELAIPEHAAQSFASSLVSHTYFLHVEFIVLKRPGTFQNDYTDRRHAYFVGNTALGVDVVDCQLPLNILPALFSNFQDHVTFHL